MSKVGWGVGDGRAHFQQDDLEGFLEEAEFEQVSEDRWKINERGPTWRHRQER